MFNIGFDIGIYIYYDKVFGIGDNFLFIVLCKGFDFLLMVFLWKWYVGRYFMRKICFISGKIFFENWFEFGSISW